MFAGGGAKIIVTQLRLPDSQCHCQRSPVRRLSASARHWGGVTVSDSYRLLVCPSRPRNVRLLSALTWHLCQIVNHVHSHSKSSSWSLVRRLSDTTMMLYRSGFFMTIQIDCSFTKKPLFFCYLFYWCLYCLHTRKTSRHRTPLTGVTFMKFGYILLFSIISWSSRPLFCKQHILFYLFALKECLAVFGHLLNVTVESLFLRACCLEVILLKILLNNQYLAIT